MPRVATDLQAPNERKVLGSGKMISLWPVRTGVLVDDGTAYFGAGIFPAEGVSMYAVNAEDGKLTWCNDACADAPQMATTGRSSWPDSLNRGGSSPCPARTASPTARHAGR